MNTYIFNSWFKDEFLQKEFRRVFSMFLPDDVVPDVRVVVGDQSPNGEAAHSLLDLGIIVMYADYHRKFPHEYKTTLLHEALHFVLDCESHEGFEGYFSFLKLRQKFISERVIPTYLEDFIYCDDPRLPDYTFACSGCGDRVISGHTSGVTCTSCDRNMLLVGGL